jgi:hypothetical protein
MIKGEDKVRVGDDIGVDGQILEGNFFLFLVKDTLI